MVETPRTFQQKLVKTEAMRRWKPGKMSTNGSQCGKNKPKLWNIFIG